MDIGSRTIAGARGRRHIVLRICLQSTATPRPKHDRNRAKDPLGVLDAQPLHRHIRLVRDLGDDCFDIMPRISQQQQT